MLDEEFDHSLLTFHRSSLLLHYSWQRTLGHQGACASTLSRSSLWLSSISRSSVPLSIGCSWSKLSLFSASARTVGETRSIGVIWLGRLKVHWPIHARMASTIPPLFAVRRGNLLVFSGGSVLVELDCYYTSVDASGQTGVKWVFKLGLAKCIESLKNRLWCEGTYDRLPLCRDQGGHLRAAVTQVASNYHLCRSVGKNIGEDISAFVRSR